MNKKFLLIALVFILLLACGGTSAADPTPTPEENAWYACTLFIQKQLGLPMNDAQDYNPSGVTIIENNHYEVIVHYAQQGSTYRCELLKHANGDTELLSLDVR